MMCVCMWQLWLVGWLVGVCTRSIYPTLIHHNNNTSNKNNNNNAAVSNNTVRPTKSISYSFFFST